MYNTVRNGRHSPVIVESPEAGLTVREVVEKAVAMGLPDGNSPQYAVNGQPASESAIVEDNDVIVILPAPSTKGNK